MTTLPSTVSSTAFRTCIIAIDGGAGSGKSTAVERLTQWYRLRGLNTLGLSSGLLWRAFTLLAIERYFVPSTPPDQIVARMGQLDPDQFIAVGREAGICLVDGWPHIDSVHGHIALPASRLKSALVDLAVPYVSRHDSVRAHLNALIGDALAAHDGVIILDGRDMSDLATRLIGSGQLQADLITCSLTVSDKVAAQRTNREVAEIAERNRRDRRITRLSPNAKIINTDTLKPVRVAQAIDAQVCARRPDITARGVILVLGPPRAGKKAPSEWLAKVFGGVVYSSGNLLRDAATRGDLDPNVAAGMHAGGLVPNEVFRSVLERAIAETPLDRPLILDGVAKRSQEAPWLERFLLEQGRRIVRVFHVEIDQVTMLERVRQEGRPDDHPEAQRHRWDNYLTETMQSIDYFERRGLVTQINGQQSPTLVLTEFARYLRQLGLIT